MGKFIWSAALLLLGVGTAPAFAGNIAPNFQFGDGGGFALHGVPAVQVPAGQFGGFLDPELLVDFNPQPNPLSVPPIPSLVLDDPTHPTLSNPATGLAW